MKLNRKLNPIVDEPEKEKKESKEIMAPDRILERVQKPVEFNAEMRRKFVDLAQLYWPNVSKICRMLDISREAYRMACYHDPIFRQAMSEIQEGRIDEVEERVMDDALHSKAFISQITLLKAYRSDRFDRAKKVDITHNQSRLESQFKEVFDAEIVEDGK